MPMVGSAERFAIRRHPLFPVPRLQHHRCWSGAGPMPMQPPEALQKHVGRYRIRHEQIGINVEGLLQGLRPHNGDARPLTARAEYPNYLPVEMLAVHVCIS